MLEVLRVSPFRLRLLIIDRTVRSSLGGTKTRNGPGAVWSDGPGLNNGKGTCLVMHTGSLAQGSGHLKSDWRVSWAVLLQWFYIGSGSMPWEFSIMSSLWQTTLKPSSNTRVFTEHISPHTKSTKWALLTPLRGHRISLSPSLCLPGDLLSTEPPPKHQQPVLIAYH